MPIDPELLTTELLALGLGPDDVRSALQKADRPGLAGSFAVAEYAPIRAGAVAATVAYEIRLDALGIEIGLRRVDGRGQPVVVTLEVTRDADAAYRSDAGEIGVVLYDEGRGETLAGFRVGPEGVRLHGVEHEPAADFTVEDGGGPRLLGVWGDEADRSFDRLPEEIPAALRAGVTAGRCGDGRSWLLEIESATDRSLGHVAGLLALGYRSGGDPAWRLRLNPSGHDLLAAERRRHGADTNASPSPSPDRPASMNEPTGRRAVENED